MPLFSHSSNGYLGYGADGDDGVCWADMIQPYLKSTQVLDCPSDDKSTKPYGRGTLAPGGPFLDITTYSYGYATPTGEANPCGVAGRALAALEDASGTLMVVEDGRQNEGEGAETQGRVIPSSTDDLGMLAGKVNGLRYPGAGAFEFGEHAFNALYADGHVKWTRLSDIWDGGQMRPWTIAAD